MPITADEIIELAKGARSLSTKQIAQIERLAPKMPVADLEKLQNMILDVRNEEIAAMKEELEIRKKVAAKYEEYKADKAREALEAKEEKVSAEEEAAADQLLSNM